MKLLKYCCWLIVLALLLGACAEGDTGGTNASVPSTQPTKSPAVIATGTFQEYPLPQTNAGLMRPAIDHEGRLWFGEMALNYLAVFDPRTKSFKQMTPPHGRSGIMGITVGPDDSIWFAEQYANYIGHYIPDTSRYQVYPLPTFKAPDPGDASKTLTLPVAPNDLVLDARGNVWFTELNADAVGKLDPHTGRLQTYYLSATKSVQILNPYGITVDPRGNIWFTESSRSRIGRIDPTTGKMQFYTFTAANAPLMEIASDPQGKLWITSFNANLLLSFDPRTGTFTPYRAPSSGGQTNGIYGLTVSSTGAVWITVPAANAIAHLDPATGHFTYYPIPTPASFPLGIALASNHTFWFTETSGNKLGTLRP